jgi:hypothetical protein
VSKRSSTTKDIALLHQLYKGNQLKLAPEFQRNNVWPTQAKAYLIDTILSDRPIPILFFQRTTSPQTGRPSYAVIDGQQRLRAIFEFLNNRFSLVESECQDWKGMRFDDLAPELQTRIFNYDLVIEEISGYSSADIQDMFVRMNKYLVRLSRQELRHARMEGAFKDFVERLGHWKFWKKHRVFSNLQIRRMRAVEFAAELTILMIEGPQDKKKAIDLYYGRYKTRFRQGTAIRDRLRAYMKWIEAALPDLSSRRYRRPVDLYSLIGALDYVSDDGINLSKLDPVGEGLKLREFENRTKARDLKGMEARYVVAASRQTDNIAPRNTRIAILSNILAG